MITAIQANLTTLVQNIELVSLANSNGRPNRYFCKGCILRTEIKLSTAVDKPVDNSGLSAVATFNLIYAKLPESFSGSFLRDDHELIWGIPMAGKLYIVGTPIGNLEDISSRVKRILNEVNLVFAEDTRVSIKLLSHIGVSKTLISCHDFNEEKRALELEKYAADGQSVALISDAGMPLISDPGHKFVQKALALGMEIICIPGPSSILLALIGSGLPCERFAFEGFLPEKAGERKKRLEHLKNDDRTLVFFLPITDLARVLPEINEIMGNRQACLCRELTKKYEEYIRGSVLDILKVSQERELKGESVFVLAGSSSQARQFSEEELLTRMQELLKSGARLKDASSLLAKESGWTSSDIYKLGLKIKEQEEYNQ